MEGFVLLIHIVVSLLLVVVVLLQSGKSADLAGAFGGMGSQSTFGPRGSATFMSKLTTTLAVLFMVTSLSLWILASKGADGGSVLTPGDGAQQQQTTGDSNTGGTENQPTEGTTPQTGDDAKKDEAAGTTDNQSGTTDAGKTENKTENTTDPAKTEGSNTENKESGNTGDSKEGSQG